MNARNDFLDSAVDNEFGTDGTGEMNTEMCSYMQSEMEEMCSSLHSDKSNP